MKEPFFVVDFGKFYWHKTLVEFEFPRVFTCKRVDLSLEDPSPEDVSRADIYLFAEYQEELCCSEWIGRRVSETEFSDLVSNRRSLRNVLIDERKAAEGNELELKDKYMYIRKDFDTDIDTVEFDDHVRPDTVTPYDTYIGETEE